MKVLMVCTEKLPVPAVRGGAIATYIDGITSLVGKEYELTILSTNDPSLADDEVVNHIRYVRKNGSLIETYREGIIEFLKVNSSFDIIHIFNRPRFVLPVKKHAPTARIILSMHNNMFRPEKIKFEEGVAAIEHSDKIITNSNYIRKVISDSFPDAKPKLITIYSDLCMRLGKNRRKKVETHFIWSRVAKEILSVWEGVENVASHGISYTEKDNSATQNPPIEDVIEEINEQVQSTEETSFTAPVELLKHSEPIKKVIDELNEQIDDSEPIEDVIEDLNDQIDDPPSSHTVKKMKDPKTIEDVVEDINEQIDKPNR